MNVQDLIKTIIKQRTITFHLVTIGDLKNLRENSILNEIFFALFSLAIGGSLSAYLAKNYPLAYILFVIGLMMIAFSFYFFWKRWNVITDIAQSKEISLPEAEGELRILEAYYYTDDAHRMDVKPRLEENIRDNQIRMPINNWTMALGEDPHKGVKKTLSVRYQLDGVVFSDLWREDEILRIP